MFHNIIWTLDIIITKRLKHYSFNYNAKTHKLIITFIFLFMRNNNNWIAEKSKNIPLYYSLKLQNNI